MNSKKRIVFDCVDAYTAGNPVRLVKSPQPILEGTNIAEKRHKQVCKEQHNLNNYNIDIVN